MIQLIYLLIRVLLQPQLSLATENLALRQQLATYYDRLGGAYAIAAMVDDFIDRIMVTPILKANPKVDEVHHRVPKRASNTS
jgi:hypothetical protein